jgi:hypothetical protein
MVDVKRACESERVRQEEFSTERGQSAGEVGRPDDDVPGKGGEERGSRWDLAEEASRAQMHE